TVRLWDAGTGEPVGQPLRGHTDSVWSVLFSPDGTRIVTGSRDKTVRLWHAVMGQPSQQCAELGHPAFSDEHRTIEAATTMTLNTPNNHFIRFSDSGWVTGPKRRLLFWVPPASRHSFWSPGTALVIPSGAELDLSRMTHGQHWQKCREE
ncbi:uncharacterized protein BJ212DRAFT_1244930, partial [Suillus subaureus]